MNEHKSRLTVLGIGNILMRDEGVGVRLLEALQSARAWPDDVEFVDGGVGGLSLLSVIEQAQVLLVLDAADMRLPAGETRVVTPEQLSEADSQGRLSLHEVPFAETLRLCAEHFRRPADVRILAIQVSKVEPGLELSDELRTSMADLVRQASDLIEQSLRGGPSEP